MGAGLVGDGAVVHGSAGDSRCSGGPRRRVVTVDGARGVLVRREGCWVLGNDAEVRMLEALRESVGARSRLLALVEVLNAGVVDGSGLRRLNRLLGEVGGGPPCLVRVPDEWLGPVAYACACWDSVAAGRWLGWALSARLDGGLVQDWLPGPGLESILRRSRLADRGFGRETHWICEMPAGFWARLGSHRWEVLKDIAVASDPAAPRRVLAQLAGSETWRHELLDLVASNPRTPMSALEEIAFASLASPQAQMRVAQNLNTGRRVLTRLASNSDAGVRLAVALNPGTPAAGARRAGRRRLCACASGGGASRRCRR